MLYSVCLFVSGVGSSGRILVELRPSHEAVEVSADELADRGSSSRQEQRQQQQQHQEDRQHDRAQNGSHSRAGARQDPGRDRDRDGGRNQHSRQRDGDRRSRHRDEDPQRQRHSSCDAVDRQADRQRHQHQQQRLQVLPPHKLWVAPLIRVRVVDKRLQQGRLYLKKGVVLDVAPDGSCDVQMEEGRQVVTAHQDQLETVVPKEAGAAVMVVQGKHKGRKGRLLQVSLSSGAAALQLVGDMAVVRLLLDDVAQFMGHLEEEDE